jgi:3-oxoacyl-[acyl-carrier protein] reductase
MDLGISGRKALVTAASQGLGKAIAFALAQEGVDITIVARRKEVVEEAAQEIRKATGANVIAVAADITSAAGRSAALAIIPEPDIIVNSAGGTPPGDFRQFGAEEWAAALTGLMLTPIELMKATLSGMVQRRFGRVVNITSKGMRVPGNLHPLGNGARGGLTAFVSTIAPEYAQHNVTINNMLPGPFDTDRMIKMAEFSAKQNDRTFEEEVAIRTAEVPAKRYGRPEEFGATCAFLCSCHAGFITGQNILIDGGSATTTF